MHHREFEPPLSLRNSIQCFWYDRIELTKLQAGFEVVPDGYVEIIFHFGSGCSIAVDAKLLSLPSPFMIGLLDKPVEFYAQSDLEIIAIRCNPWTVSDLLGLPQAKGGVQTLEHPVVTLQKALSGFIRERKIEEAIECVEHYFLQTQSENIIDTTLSKAGTAIRDANGTLPVSAVADFAHATVRTLERKFRESSGHTVKDVSGLIRFEQVRNRLLTDPKTNIAGLAEELGYSDQSHLSREFKRYSGTTPAAFARKANSAK